MPSKEHRYVKPDVSGSKPDSVKLVFAHLKQIHFLEKYIVECLPLSSDRDSVCKKDRAVFPRKEEACTYCMYVEMAGEEKVKLGQQQCTDWNYNLFFIGFDA